MFDRAAIMDADLRRHRAGFDVELFEQVAKGDAGRGPVHDQPHRAVVGMGAQKHHRAVETRVAHARHGDQQRACERSI